MELVEEKQYNFLKSIYTGFNMNSMIFDEIYQNISEEGQLQNLDYRRWNFNNYR